MLKQLRVDELQPGMFVSKVVEQNGPVKIRRIGFVKSAEMIDGLKEMGVTIVEIDVDQSLDVELETTDKLTPTEKLLANDKRVEQVDRELSQQFHNSLFMPAVEEMPSRWELYAKPYTVTSLAVFFGFVIGFTLMQVPAIWQSVTAPEQIVTQPESQIEEGVTDQARTITNTADTNPEKQSESEITESRPQQTEATALLVVSPSANETINDTSTITEIEDNEETAMLVTEAEPESDSSTQTFQGITLEEGERILGYQGEGLEESNEEVLETEEDSINPELLAKINEVVESLESDPIASSDPVTVRDTFLRVDQLTPLIQDQLPGMSFSAHMYASDPLDRWVRVNGRRLQEGDSITGDLVIEEITEERVLLNFRGQRFTMKALSDWG